MAIHVYMSVEPCTLSPDGRLLPDQAAVFNYRGEAGPADDPHSFRKFMARKGHLVVLTAGRIEGAKQRGARNGPESVLYSELGG